MNAGVTPAADIALPAPESPLGRVRKVLRGLLLHGLFLAIAAGALGAYEHLRLQGRSTASLVSLIVAAGFGLAPVRALARELFALEGKALHLVHGIGGVAVIGLAAGGVISGGPLLSHAALAPFAIMGAAQALMHPDHPRSAEQAQALRRFATSLPEVEQIARAGDLHSPANVRQAVAALTDLVAKAQALGETELRADPGFQSALQRSMTRYGLSFGLDAVDRAIDKLSANPAAESAVPELHRRVAAARREIEKE